MKNREKQVEQRFYKKARNHAEWLQDFTAEMEVLTRKDLRCIQINLQTLYNREEISTRYLLQHKSLIQSLLCQNIGRIVNAETYNQQILLNLHKLRQEDEFYLKLDKLWNILKEKFQQREEFLKGQISFTDVLLDLAMEIQSIEAIWKSVREQNLSEMIIQIWINQLEAAMRKMSELTTKMEDCSTDKLQDDIISQLFARFWGATWTLLSALCNFNKFYSEMNKLTCQKHKIYQGLIKIKVCLFK